MADAISLHTYRDDDDFEHVSSSADETDDDHVHHESTSKEYDRLQLLLHSRIEYAVASSREEDLPRTLDTGDLDQTWNNLWREEDSMLAWKPTLSGRRGCVATVTVLVSTLLAHGIVACTTRKPWWLSTYLPPSLAVVLYIACKGFIDGETRRRSYSVDPRGGKDDKLYPQLARFKIVIIMFICPLVAVPMLPGTYFTSNRPWTPNGCTHDRL
jgi:hypothetical protein